MWLNEKSTIVAATTNTTPVNVAVVNDDSFDNSGGISNIMLTSDVELLFNTHKCIQFKSFFPNKNCPYHNPDETSKSVISFSKDIRRFYTVFSGAWRKMTEFGHAQNTLRHVSKSTVLS